TATLVGQNGQALSTLLTAQKPAGSQTLAITPPPGLLNGQYAIALAATSGAKVASALVPFVLDDILGGFRATGPTLSYPLDRTPPVITVVSYRNLRFRISEPATLTLVVGANRYTRTLRKAATTQFWLRTKPAAYRLIARDAAGNSSVVRYRR